MAEADQPPSLHRVPAGVADDPYFQKKYELERELGVGGSGVVFCARHRELDERVAIKFLLAGPENAEALARFRREARAANRVKSEHVVRIVDVSTTPGGVPYVVMEYLEGTDLERLLLESPDAQLPVRDAVDFVLQACEALAECHAMGIVHRDLKPSNLFCTHGADGLPTIKVLDFGISKLGSVTVDEAMTGRHAIMGSPRYMSPEQFATPADVDRRTDIWALGIMMYELITGKAPFSGNTLISIWESVKRDVPTPLEELRRDVPRALGPVVLRCIEKEPANRYQNVAELAKALLPLASERSRTTVARIVRIVESPGVTTASLSLPPSGRVSANGATSVSVHSGMAGPRSSRTLVLGAMIAVAAAGMVLLARPRVPSHSQAPSTLGAAQPTPTEPTSRAGVLNTAGPLVPQPTVLPSPVSSDAPPAMPSASAGEGDARSPRTVRRGSPTAPALREIAEPVVVAPRPSATASVAAPVAVGSATPSASHATPAASSTATFKELTAPSKAPWIVDIVEDRKGKSGGTP